MREGFAPRAAVALAAAAVLVPTAAWACRCVGLTPAAAYRAADAVVLAEVMAVSDRDPRARRYRLRVAESWKRRLPASVTVRTEPTSCAAELVAGRRYLLYLDAGAGGFATQDCAGNLPAERAGAALKALRSRRR